ncbi:hypothetical protein B7494_g3380 [Chlorociboria aeruginascens]|nr:hypothetical protein B7494_g3380 [Chlorociboria aeruginascens]
MMNSPPVPKEQSQSSTSKLRRSCESCRASKSRCCPSNGDCDRCQSRVAEMEQRLEGIVALLSTGSQPRNASSSMTPLIPIPESMPSGLAPGCSSRVTPSLPGTTRIPYQSSMFTTSHLIFDDLQDVISRGIVDFTQAEDFVRLFRNNASNFPFVVIPSHVSLDSLRHQRPFLLLSILTTVSSYSNFKLQDILEEEVRESLSRRVIMNGEKSIDLLQGLLVYVAWYHFYFKAERQQLYQLSQMAAAMIVDLELNKPLQPDYKPSNFKINIPLVNRNRSQDLLSDEFVEGRRAFLGAYYLCSSLCLGLRKPNALKYIDYMEECCQSLANTREMDSDYFLPYFIRLQRLAEEVNDAFDYDSGNHLPQLDCFRIELLAKNFNQKLNQLETAFPADVWNHTSISMLYFGIRVYMNEIGFHAVPPSPMDMMPGQSSRHSWYSSVARTEALIRCQDATRDYMDRFLSLPSHELRHFLVTDFIRLVYSVLVLGKFTTGCDAPSLNAAHTRKSANLGNYLDALITKLGGTGAYTSNPLERDCFTHLGMFFRRCKAWYTESLMDPFVSEDTILGCAELSFMEILPTQTKNRIDLANKDIFPELNWTDLINDWPTPDPKMTSMDIGV